MNKQGGRPILFVCPQCGGEHFGRDTADDGLGGVKILRTVRCHTPGCGWRGEWPPRWGQGKGRMSMVLGPQIVTPDPTPGWFTANWEAASKPQLEWLAVNGGYMQKIIAGRYLRDWAKDHPGV